MEQVFSCPLPEFRRARVAVSWLLAVIAIAAPIKAEKRGMTLLDVINMPQLVDPQISPDGKQILFVESRPNWKANRRIQHIWRVNVDGSGLTQMTDGVDGENTPLWSPDGKIDRVPCKTRNGAGGSGSAASHACRRRRRPTPYDPRDGGNESGLGA